MPSGNAHVLGGSSNASTWTVSAGQNAQPFVQQDKDATENDDSAPDPGPKVWHLPECRRAEHCSPEDLSVVERRYKRGRREFESPDQAIVPKPAEDAEAAQNQRIRPTCRRVPHEGQRQAGQYEADQNHVGVGRLRGVMPGDLARNGTDSSPVGKGREDRTLTLLLDAAHSYLSGQSTARVERLLPDLPVARVPCRSRGARHRSGPAFGLAIIPASESVPLNGPMKVQNGTGNQACQAVPKRSLVARSSRTTGLTQSDLNRGRNPPSWARPAADETGPRPGRADAPLFHARHYGFPAPARTNARGAPR